MDLVCVDLFSLPGWEKQGLAWMKIGHRGDLFDWEEKWYLSKLLSLPDPDQEAVVEEETHDEVAVVVQDSPAKIWETEVTSLDTLASLELVETPCLRFSCESSVV